MPATFQNKNDEDAFRATIGVGLGKIPKTVREQLLHQNWYEREKAKREVVRLAMDAMTGFTIIRDKDNLECKHSIMMAKPQKEE